MQERRVINIRRLGALVRQRREDLGLRQQDVADAALVSRTWLSDLETAATTIELSRVLRLLDVLDLDLRVGEAEEQVQGGDDLLDYLRTFGVDHDG